MSPGATLLLLLAPSSSPSPPLVWPFRGWRWDDDGDEATPLPTAADFWEAMVSWVDLNVPELTGLLWSYLAEDESDGQDVEMPFAVYEKGTAGPIARNAAGEGLHVRDFTIAVYSPDDAEANSLARTLAESLDMAPLVFEDGTLIYLRPTGVGDSNLDPDPGPRGVHVYQAVIGFRSRIMRSY